jgi:hypothetical protein
MSRKNIKLIIMATQTINVTACDNELMLTAYTATGSYTICRILSASGLSVSVTINIYAGQYQGALLLDGTISALSDTYSVALDTGEYNLVGVGINWGGPTGYAASLNETPILFTPTNIEPGVAAYTSPVPLIVS